jgi:signal transduction histidine kinase
MTGLLKSSTDHLMSQSDVSRTLLSHSRRPCISLPAVLLLAIGELLFLARPLEAASKQVLVLYSTRRDAQIAVVGDRELPKVMAAGLREGVDYYSEYIDRGRFQDPAYRRAFAEFLSVKYSDHRFDLVIAMQDLALEFLADHRDALFPDTPIVYFASSESTRRLPNSAGVLAPIDFRSTLRLALDIQPYVRKVFVVSGADAGGIDYGNLAVEQLAPFKRQVEIFHLSGLATADLEARLASLSSDSIVYYVVANRDGAGQVVHPLEYVDRLVAASSVPVYSWVDSVMGRGILGGSLKNQTAEADAVAKLAVRILAGERADSIAMGPYDLNQRQVDWRQLRRFGINEARVPTGTLIQFEEPTLWDRYRYYLLGSVVVLVGQTVLVFGLLVQHVRRRRAEEKVRQSERALRTSNERIRDLAGRVLDAQEAERARIARELHDDVGQQLVLLSIELELLAGGGDTAAARSIREALTRLNDVAHKIHDVSHQLHPAKLRLIGLVKAIEGLRNELSAAGIPATFAHREVPADLPPEATLALYRVAQESLQNAFKHSRARQVTIDLRRRGDALVLEITDDGVGFDVAQAAGKGLGLISMGERLEALSGAFEVESSPGFGTRIEASVQLAPSREHYLLALPSQEVRLAQESMTVGSQRRPR